MTHPTAELLRRNSGRDAQALWAWPTTSVTNMSGWSASSLILKCSHLPTTTPLRTRCRGGGHPGERSFEKPRWNPQTELCVPAAMRFHRAESAWLGLVARRVYRRERGSSRGAALGFQTSYAGSIPVARSTKLRDRGFFAGRGGSGRLRNLTEPREPRHRELSVDRPRRRATQHPRGAASGSRSTNPKAM
jgi:hypothetical protein